MTILRSHIYPHIEVRIDGSVKKTTHRCDHCGTSELADNERILRDDLGEIDEFTVKHKDCSATIGDTQ